MTFNLNLQHHIDAELASRPHEWVWWLDLVRRYSHDATLEGAYVGTYSLTAPRLGLTFVSRRHDWCGAPASASSVARRILTHGLKLLGKKRIPWDKESFAMLSIPQPLYYKPTEGIRRLIYVDIQSCFFEIYSRLPFDFWFKGNYAMGGNLFFRDFLPLELRQYKICRNALVGCLRVQISRKLIKGRIVESGNKNKLLSPQHWGFMAHMLHIFAVAAVQFGAIYYNTDGAIFLNERDANAWSEYVRNWGLIPSQKHDGLGIVWGIGCYKIGNDNIGATQIPNQPTDNLITPSDKIRQAWLKWL